jgi:hypothetical protein
MDTGNSADPLDAPWVVRIPSIAVARETSRLCGVVGAAVAVTGVGLMAWGSATMGESADWLRDVPALRVGLALALAGAFIGGAALLQRFRRRLRRSTAAPWMIHGTWPRPVLVPVTRLPKQRPWIRRIGTLMTALPPGTRRWLALALAVSVPIGLVLFGDWFQGADRRWTFAATCSVCAIVLLLRLTRRPAEFDLEIDWPTFPIPVGGRAAARVRYALPPPADVGPAECWLVCVREATGRPLETILALPIVGWVDAQDAPGVAIIEFDVPASAPGTDLLGETIHAWYLVHVVRSPEKVFAGVTPAPVYAVGVAGAPCAERS